MTPEAALEAQIERYRQMMGEEPLMISLRLHALSCEIAWDGIRSQHLASARTRSNGNCGSGFNWLTPYDRSGIAQGLPAAIESNYLHHCAVELAVQKTLQDILDGKLKPKHT